ncbi:TPA: hypothetical protein ACGEYZ_000418 [Klebsiella pneumoniae]
MNIKYIGNRILTAFFLFFIMNSFTLANNFTIGVGIHPLSYHMEDDQLINIFNKYNIKSFRTDYFWDKVEKQPHEYRPIPQLDDLIDKSVSENIIPMIIINYGNELYGGGLPLDETSVEAYANYSSWLADHLKGKVKYFEVWNEWCYKKNPKDKSYNPLSNYSAESYFNLVKQASLAIKKNNPDAIILAGGFNPLNNSQTPWVEHLLELGILNYIDGFSIHPYSNNLPNKDFEITDSYFDFFSKKYKSNINVYITEMGYSNYPYGKVRGAKADFYLESYMNLAKERPYIKGVWWYDLINDGDDPNNGEHNFGLLNRDLSEKPLMKSFSSSLSAN